MPLTAAASFTLRPSVGNVNWGIPLTKWCHSTLLTDVYKERELETYAGESEREEGLKILYYFYWSIKQQKGEKIGTARESDGGTDRWTDTDRHTDI